MMIVPFSRLRPTLITGLASLGAAFSSSALQPMATHPGAEHAAQVAAFEFVPDTQIYGFPMAPVDKVVSDTGLARLPTAQAFNGELPSDRLLLPIEDEALDLDAFTIEFWISYHVNQPIAALALAYDDDADQNDTSSWHFGIQNGDVVFGVGEQTLFAPAIEVKGTVPKLFPEEQYKRGPNRYWHHLVGTFDGKLLTIFQNGEQIAQEEAEDSLEEAEILELAGYLGREPYMELGNIIKNVALYNTVLTQEIIQEHFEAHAALIAEGILHEKGLHFTTTAPHQAFPTPESLTLIWETDTPAAATIAWGLNAEALANSEKLENTGERVRQYTIRGLEPATQYFYQVTVQTANKFAISQTLPFRTAPMPGDPVIFAAISDTEARPHVNTHIGRLIYRETPHLLINVGDLTDGGRTPNRVEWTHEYFAAMGHFMARVPMLPVMGNGENDFKWFTHYHALPGDAKSYYAYRYGDVAFFVLDSNLTRRDEEDPKFRESQRSWLSDQLILNSDAIWKVVTFHHPVLPERYGEISEDFVPLIEEHAVDLVLVGHHHNYRRSWPLKNGEKPAAKGPIYIQLGGGGGNISSRPDTPDPRWAMTYQGYGYSMFRILGGELYYTMHDDAGAVRDVLTLKK